MDLCQSGNREGSSYLRALLSVCREEIGGFGVGEQGAIVRRASSLSLRLFVAVLIERMRLSESAAVEFF